MCVSGCIYRHVCAYICVYVYIFARSVNCHKPWKKVIVLPYLTNGGKSVDFLRRKMSRNLFKNYIAGKQQRQDSN